MWRLMGIWASCIALAGCTLAEWNSIHREFTVKEGASQLIDVKQRAIIVSKDGMIVCAEPSPDALSIAAFGAAAEGSSSEFAASLAVNTTEGAASIGLRTQSIQLLRDAFYRLCESFLNGAIGIEEYDILQRRYQSHMVGLLAIEQLTGVVRAPSVILSSESTADAGTDLTAVVAKRKAEEERLQDLKEQKAEAENSEVGEGKPYPDQNAKDAKIEELDQKINDQAEVVAALDQAIASARNAIASGKTGGAIETITGVTRVTEKVAEAVTEIARMILTADYTPQLCFSYLRNKQNYEASGGLSAELVSFCKEYLTVYISFLKEKAKANVENGPLILGPEIGE